MIKQSEQRSHFFEISIQQLPEPRQSAQLPRARFGRLLGEAGDLATETEVILRLETEVFGEKRNDRW